MSKLKNNEYLDFDACFTDGESIEESYYECKRCFGRNYF